MLKNVGKLTRGDKTGKDNRERDVSAAEVTAEKVAEMSSNE